MIIHRIPFFLLLFSLLLTIPAAGCRSRGQSKSKNPPKSETGNTKAEKDDDSGADNIKIFNGDGKAILKLKEKNYGYKLYNITADDPGGQQPIAKLKFE